MHSILYLSLSKAFDNVFFLTINPPLADYQIAEWAAIVQYREFQDSVVVQSMGLFWGYF